MVRNIFCNGLKKKFHFLIAVKIEIVQKMWQKKGCDVELQFYRRHYCLSGNIKWGSSFWRVYPKKTLKKQYSLEVEYSLNVYEGKESTVQSTQFLQFWKCLKKISTFQLPIHYYTIKWALYWWSSYIIIIILFCNSIW